MRIMTNVYKILVGNPEGKMPLRRSRRKWEDNIKMDLKTNRVGSCGLDSTGSRQKPVPGSREHDTDISGSIKGGEILEYLSDY
jgi:hypothetical protein